MNPKESAQDRSPGADHMECRDGSLAPAPRSLRRRLEGREKAFLHEPVYLIVTRHTIIIFKMSIRN